MDSDSSIYIILIVISIVLSGFFSASETAFSTYNRIRMKNLSEKGNKRAKLVIRLSSEYDVFISTILIGNNLVNILSASLGTLIFIQLLGQDVGATVATVAMTIVVLIFGEVSPKTIAKEYPESFSLFAAPIVNFLIKVFLPFNYFFKQWKKLLSLIFKPSTEHLVSEEELLVFVDEVQESGGIDESQGSLIRSAIEFSDLEVIDIYTPRIDVVAASTKESYKNIYNTFIKYNFSRLPVFEDSIDHIIGFINYKDFFTLSQSNKDLSTIIKPIIYVTKSKKIRELLRELQKSKYHMAVVVDEFGGTAGIVTLEDILEELVGEIWDEHDTVVHSITKISESEYHVMGNASIEDLMKKIGRREVLKTLTVNGWIIDKLQSIPIEGQVYKVNGYEFEITQMNGKRIETVSIRLNEFELIDKPI